MSEDYVRRRAEMYQTEVPITSMTPETFRALLTGLGFTQSSLARALRTDPRTIRRWALGEVPVPYAVQMLLEGKPLTSQQGDE